LSKTKKKPKNKKKTNPSTTIKEFTTTDSPISLHHVFHFSGIIPPKLYPSLFYHSLNTCTASNVLGSGMPHEKQTCCKGNASNRRETNINKSVGSNEIRYNKRRRHTIHNL
jgi:hypothetical protein